MKKRKKKKYLYNTFIIFLGILIVLLLILFNNNLLNLKDLNASILISDNYIENNNKMINELNKEIDELKKQNNTGKLLTDFKVINASIISRNNSYWNDLITINKGYKNGVKEGYAVISNNTLIGYVSHVNKNTSIVSLITGNNDNYISAKFTYDNKDYFGIIRKYNIKTNELYLENVVGDINEINIDVITSGLSNNMPSGIYIGKIKEIKKDKYNLSNIITITPGTDYNNINLIEVIGND